MTRRDDTPVHEHACELLARIKGIHMAPEQLEAQRRSFAYGNARLEDDTVTMEDVERVAELLK